MSDDMTGVAEVNSVTPVSMTKEIDMSHEAIMDVEPKEYPEMTMAPGKMEGMVANPDMIK